MLNVPRSNACLPKKRYLKLLKAEKIVVMANSVYFDNYVFLVLYLKC